MPRVALVHWDEDEAAARVARLAAAGFDAEFHADARDPSGMRRWIDSPPDAILVDLSRLPSHGRDVAIYFRGRKATRRVPLVFLDGAPEKVEGIRRVLPDAVYASWRGVSRAVRAAIARPPAAPVVPRALAGYSGTPLPKKLGIKEGSSIALLHAPAGFRDTLGELPTGVRTNARVGARTNVALLFASNAAALKARFPPASKALPEGARLWICWPKRTSGIAVDLSEKEVRRTGLAAGLVDFKIAAIDATWSGLCFTRRR